MGLRRLKNVEDVASCLATQINDVTRYEINSFIIVSIGSRIVYAVAAFPATNGRTTICVFVIAVGAITISINGLIIRLSSCL